MSRVVPRILLLSITALLPSSSRYTEDAIYQSRFLKYLTQEIFLYI
ncbi:hypothetical protein BMS3Bbin06_02173 [bacterium BMS3Bbin06]|nr:hypothetical protein BMS3Bbin06_02173 [bacterium BMS3Bbin06]